MVSGCTRVAYAFAVVASIISGIAAAQESESERFHALLDAEWDYAMREFPEYATYVGYPGQNDRWTDQSLDAIARRKAHAADLLDRIQTIDPSKLDARDRLSYDLFLKETRESIEGQRFPGEYLVLSQLEGVHQSIVRTLMRTPMNTLADCEAALARLDAAAELIRQHRVLLEEGLKRGVTPPRITLRDVPELIDNVAPEDPAETPLLRPFANLPGDLPEADRERIRSEARRITVEKVYPELRAYREYVANAYIPSAVESIAMSDLPDGAAWYAFNVRQMTTTDMTPDEIHELGLNEVKRIRGEMERIIASLEFEGGFDAFFDFLRTDPQFYFETPEQLIAGYRDIAKRADPELMKLFGRLPRQPYGILPVPAFIEKSQTTAYYEPGSQAAGRPGYFFANTYDLPSRPKWEMEALTLHEAVPGHHLQIAIAQELEDVPEFRKWGGYTSFIEGWGLYAESLGEEMGLYTDPYSKFGQLTYEIWRAIRLVVDTGMHAKGWSRQQAIDYFLENAGKAEHDIVVEVDRYIVWPGQALAYKIGELKFKELRARAKEALGDTFDIRAFHDTLLEEGALPLDIVKARVDAWIEAQRAARN